MNIIEKMFGTHSQRELKRIMPIVDKIDSLRPSMQALSDEELRGKTREYKKRLEEGETLDDLLPEAFATVREAAKRVLNMEHYRVQLIGGIILHQGRIAEMRTGEGKTLVSTLPAYLNALEGKGVHIVTVNDYLAHRDAEWMGKVHEFLGLTVGVVLNSMKNDERRAQYACDITYVTNNELGFDYLRDNMVIYKEQLVQRDLHYAIIDEVDSVLIDEARTPLIISGQSGKSTKLYEVCDILARQLERGEASGEMTKMTAIMGEEIIETGDFIVNEKDKIVNLTEQGVHKVEKFFNIENLADPENLEIQHNIILALRAHNLMFRDQDYVVKDDEVLIVDEFTGRIMPGRRYSDGLHQAIEAKEGVKVENESKTLATITFQNFFRLYKKLSGMTGTAQTEEEEFQEIYKLDVIVIPTNKPLARVDASDSIYKTENGKFNAVIEEVVAAHAKGQPVLIGTVSIEKSEELSRLLRKRGIKHSVLNAKFHDKEAEIVAQAGKKGAVTIATNMAGRGTDIVLGGNAEFMAKDEMRRQGFEEEMLVQATGFAETDDENIINARQTYQELHKRFKQEIEPEQKEVLAAGGLYIIGTERHESRRIDNQLRGRAGRQGDVGASKFYLSLEDDLMRLFAPERINRVMETFGLDENEAIESKMLSNAIETAQQRVEGRNFDIRKHVLQYDDVNNQQREMIYKQRDQVLDGEDMKNYILNMMRDTASNIIAVYSGEMQNAEEWDWEALKDHITAVFGELPVDTFEISEHEMDHMTKESLCDHLMENILAKYSEKEADFGDAMREVERIILLRVVDQKWMDHIDNMEQLRQGINLRAYAQHDPVVEYKFEAMDMFEEMIDSIKEDTVKYLFHVVPQNKIERQQVAKPVAENHGSDDGTVKKQPVRRKVEIGRNDPCPCGSGKKYKHCCLEKDQMADRN